MEDKVKFELSPIDEENGTTAAKEPSESTPNFSIEEVQEIESKEQEPQGVSSGNIKANNKEKSPTMGYVYGGVFIALGTGSILIGVLVGGYKMVGAICAVLAFLASYAMLKNLFEAKKIKALLDSEECKTVDELMVKLKRKNKYNFMRDLGGMIKSGYIPGYEVVNNNEIRKINDK